MKPDSSLNSLDTALLIPWMFMDQILPHNPWVDPHPFLAFLSINCKHRDLGDLDDTPEATVALGATISSVSIARSFVPFRNKTTFPVFSLWLLEWWQKLFLLPLGSFANIKYSFDLRKYFQQFLHQPRNLSYLPDHGNEQIWMSSISCSINCTFLYLSKGSFFVLLCQRNC